MAHEPLQPLTVGELQLQEEAVSAYEAGVTGEVATALIERGLDIETITSRRVGVVDEPAPGHERYVGWIAIPYLGPRGEVFKIRFRCAVQDCDHKANHHGKYEDLPHATPRLYNVGAVVRPGDTICITEGEFDTMMLEQLGYNSVAIPGAQAWRPHYRKILEGYTNILLFGDPDTAGREFNTKIRGTLRQSRVINLRDGDVCETVQKQGVDHLRELIEGAPR